MSFAGLEVYPCHLDDAALARTRQADALRLWSRSTSSSGTGAAAATVWGCDLSAEYVHINADYTT